ncbi:secreted protein [Bisporella sp. PMI_857]|nr:secreted protein [Bisporella sp. PMI_857]
MVYLRPLLLTVALPSLALAVPASPVPPSANAPASPKAFAPATWQHPGFVVSKPQLDFVKSQISAKAEPWSGALKQMLADSDAYGKYATATRSSKATATVKCGPTTNPDIGCTDERGDALAAWANALAGYVSGDETYTKNSIQLMNKWSYVVKAHELDNAVLQTAWAGGSWARAGELVRHTTKGLWADADIKQFETMLRTVYLPAVKNGETRASNWDLACLNTALGIAVFLEDKALYDSTMNLIQQAIPAAIYLESDGKLPHAARGRSSEESALQSYWYNQQTWGNSGQSGQIQETCRDLTHAGYSISSISHILETSRIQGLDLYSTDSGTRLRFALGFHAQFVTGTAPPAWLCQGKALTRVLEYITEIGYNALAFRLGQNMPKTKQYTEAQRPQGTNKLFYGWETLTHAGNRA